MQDNTDTKTPPLMPYIFLFAIALLLLIPRLDGSYFTGKYLWAEDGNVFINQASTLGISAIWTPYAGYLHAYPRIAAFIANFFALESRPYILLAAWLVSYLILISVILVRGSDLGLKNFSLLAIIALVSAQPSFGEIFFNITNSQWMLGAALTIYVLARFNSNKAQTPVEYIFLLLLCITGPFSVLLLPIILIRAWLYKDLKQYAWIYLITFCCAIVQILVMIGSGRLSSPDFDPSLSNWLKSFFQIIFFGANNPIAYIAAFVFWGLLVMAIWRRSDNFSHKKISMLFLVAAVFHIVVALYSSKGNPLAISAPGGGNRYTWIPYTLIFFGAILASSHLRKIQTLLIGSAGLIVVLNFHSISSPSLQFKSFSNFANYNKVVIPIHPQWPTYPGWHIDGMPQQQSWNSSPRIFRVDLQTLSIGGAHLNQSHESHDSLNVSSTTNDPMLIFDKPILCQKSSDIGIEINMVRAKEGWLQLFFGDSQNFIEKNSIKRWYPSGQITAQFAFPNFSNGAYLRFDPLEDLGAIKINEVAVYCLP